MFRRLRALSSLRTTVLALVTTLAISLATLLGLFEFLELRAIDAAFNWRGPVSALPGPDNDPRDTSETLIVIVAIDDESFRESGQGAWPWTRAYMAQIIDNIAAGSPKTITADIFWYEAGRDPGGDQALARSLESAGNVILANDINRVEQLDYVLEEFRRPLPELEKAALHLGLANLQRDPDSFVRRMPVFLVSPADQKAYFSWSALTALTYYQAPVPGSISNRQVQIGPMNTPLNEGRHLIVNYRGPTHKVFSQVPAYQVVNGDVDPAYFEDKIVLIGVTSEVEHDTYPTPYAGGTNPMPGVEINANVIDTLLSGDFLYRWPVLLGALVALALGVFAYLLSGIQQPILSISLAVLTTAVYVAIWLASFTRLNTEIYLVAPLASFVLGYAVPSVERAIAEQLEKRRVRAIFEQFVSPQMVEQIIDDGLSAARGKRTQLTILFSDIRGFTTLSEQMMPDQVVDLLNEYLGVMTDVIHQHGGTIDKYEGDLIMAFFNAPLPQPDHARRAVEAAIDMRLTLNQLKTRWAKDGGRPTGFDMGIGLNTGDAFVGLIGSEKRINYTCIGDSVNVASRVQDLTKDLRWPLLITEFTYEQVKDYFDCEFTDSHVVKGRTRPVGMYRVLGRKGGPENERIQPLFA
jgi:adenylate cyclase